MDLLVVGHVTRDEVDGGVRLGGAASYAALAAACLGYETALVTVAPPGEPLLEALRRAPRLHLHCVPSDVMTTFALEYRGGQRRLWLHRRARALTLDDIPPEWRSPRVAYVGTVAGECDTAFVKGMRAQFTGAGLQGWLRRTNDDGLVEPVRIADSPDIQNPVRLNVAIVSEDDHPGAEGVLLVFRGHDDVAAITRGARGAILYGRQQYIDLPAARAREVDPTGAGDVFGVVLTLELARGKRLRAAGRAAAWAAARVVEGPGLGTLPESTRTRFLRLWRTRSRGRRPRTPTPAPS
ncbi:MAG TPA: PfkB family carbohydrate kinase [Polyangia bacterium]|nr:PfkB family carbohydrate kinase [Polyangia bacterium]